MKPNAPKNRKLLKQYPFVEPILWAGLEPYAPWKDKPSEEHGIDDLVIRVEVADRNLMYRQAYNCGLGDERYIFQIDGKHKDQVMRRGEYLFAVSKTGEILNRVNWPRNDKERKLKGSEEVYAWMVLWSQKIAPNHFVNPIFDKVEHLVWVTVEAWHMDTFSDDGPGSRFGKFLCRSVRVTIYDKPECGFDELHRQASPEENLYMDSKVLMRAMLRNDRNLVGMSGRLDELCRLFQDEVYFNGMKDVLDNGDYRGASGQFGPVQVLCGEMCGYDRIMLQDAMSWVSFQLRPGAKMLYVHGMGGTLPQLRNLVKTVVKLWNEKPDLRTSFKPDQNVSVV